jgi:acetoin utilization deacetylase AcuC-like enzyme
MLTFFNAAHAAHRGTHEMFRGEMVPCFEVPDRADYVLRELQSRGWARIEDAPPASVEQLCKVHTRRYVEFLQGAWDEWVALDARNAARDAIPSTWVTRTFRDDVLPKNFHARLGLFSFDSGSPLTAGTWEAARTGAGGALAAAARMQAGERSAFVLTRPPGHHAGADFFGGYCFLNGAALAAQAFRDAGAGKVAVLDIDYHHGNGTQSIFYDRADVFFASLHGDPSTEYPFYLGHADERGVGDGLGANLNLPMAKGTSFERWRDALGVALRAIREHGAEVLVVSLGVDTFAGDPISGFKLASPDYLRVGEDIAALGLATLFMFEGGYAVAEVGVNAVNVLEGFREATG